MPAPVARAALVLTERRHVATLALMAAIPLLVAVALIGSLAALLGGAQTHTSATPSGAAFSDIPPRYLRLYRAAAASYGIDWATLAAIGKVECDHGRAPDPSCTVTGQVNSAGAGGPMQFLQSTWAGYGVNPAGQHVPDSDRWNPVDAIYSAARYLAASGAPANYEQAIFTYNHADWYVNEVLAWAARYTAATPQTAAPGQVVPGQAARITAQGYALAPADAPPAVAQMISAGNQIIHFPYLYGGGHGNTASSLNRHSPDPDGGGYDCSSAVSYLLHGAALLSEVETSAQLESFGQPGPGRWVTVYANDGHTFILIAGIAMNTVWETAVQPTIPGSGPRWQPASSVPAQISSDQYGGFTQRHPAGL